MPAKLPEPRIVQNDEGQIIRGWHPFVVEYWKLIRQSPMVGEYVQADLPRLYMLMDLVDLYWFGRRELAGEIRLQSQCFGLTPIDRRRLQWEVQRVEDGTRRKPGAKPEPEEKPVLMLRALS